MVVLPVSSKGQFKEPESCFALGCETALDPAFAAFALRLGCAINNGPNRS
jgi:hypothetical protein